MHALVVIPCLNEERLIRQASQSLGFGTAVAARHVTLVIVDNGSTDGTADAVADIAARSRPNDVVLVHEPERGFVPARSRGALEAREVARRLGLDEEHVLLIQADADTVYSPGYVEALVEKSYQAGPGALIEGVSEAPEPPTGSDAYYALERSVDMTVEPTFGDMSQDVVVDDKVAAFRLSDYFRWGGHMREYGRDGDEILAETTRLFVRARLRNGFRVRAERAVAVTSQRRTLEDPALVFATAGYPRGAKWIASFHASPASRVDMATFGEAAKAQHLCKLSQFRAGHLIGMFGLLPNWFSSGNGRSSVNGAYATLLADAPSRELVAERPGQLLDWALGGLPNELTNRVKALKSARFRKASTFRKRIATLEGPQWAYCRPASPLGSERA